MARVAVNLRTLRRFAAIVLCLGTVGLIAACGQASPAKPSAAKAGAASGSGPSPRTVAVEYMTALVQGHIKQAVSLVFPSDRSLLEVAAAGPRTVSATVHDLKAGTVSYQGDLADVTLTGQICASGGSSEQRVSGSGPATSPAAMSTSGRSSTARSAAAVPGSSRTTGTGSASVTPAIHCESNSDPKTTNPVFHLLLKQDSGRWWVKLGLPPGTK
jgi:hypothetical protein